MQFKHHVKFVFLYLLGKVITCDFFCFNSEWMVKIGVHFQKLLQNYNS